MKTCILCQRPVREHDAISGATTWKVCAKCGVKACRNCIPKDRCTDCEKRRPKPSNEPNRIATTSGSVKG